MEKEGGLSHHSRARFYKRDARPNRDHPRHGLKPNLVALDGGQGAVSLDAKGCCLISYALTLASATPVTTFFMLSIDVWTSHLGETNSNPMRVNKCEETCAGLSMPGISICKG
jgi:hypothetical protein